jgi:hypothetical protein
LPWVAVGTADGAGEADAVAGCEADGEAVPAAVGDAGTPAVPPRLPGCAVWEPAVGPEVFLASGVLSPPPVRPEDGPALWWSPAAGTGRYGESTDGPPRAVLSTSAT